MEELTPATCPDTGTATVVIVNGSRAAGESEWHYEVEGGDVAILPPADCAHQETICRECLDSWRIDYIITLAPA